MQIYDYIENINLNELIFNMWSRTEAAKWFNDALVDGWEIIKGSYEEGQIHIKKNNIKVVVYIASSTGYYKNRSGIYISNEFDFTKKLDNKNYNFEYILNYIKGI